MDAFVLAGYVAAPAWEPPAQWGLPAEAVTVSDCLTDVVTAPDGQWFTTAEAARQRTGLPVYAIGMPGSAAEALHNVYEAPLLATPGLFPDELTVLGHEVLGYDDGTWHSWLCNDLAGDAAKLGVRPGPHGLLDADGA